MDHLVATGIASDRYSWHALGGSRQANLNDPEVLAGTEILRAMEGDDGEGFSIYVTRGTKRQKVALWPSYPRFPWQLFAIDSEIPRLAIRDPGPLVEKFATLGKLALGVVVERSYAAWQRCNDPELYAARFGSTTGFRIIRIPAEPPLPERCTLDTSTNPGRYDLIHGGPAMVAAEMWLGPAFWDYAPCRKDEVVSQPWLGVRETEHFLYLNAYSEPFTRPDGEQGEIQRKLWRLLFHSDCQWPPGQVRPEESSP